MPTIIGLLILALILVLALIGAYAVANNMGRAFYAAGNAWSSLSDSWSHYCQGCPTHGYKVSHHA